MQASIRESIPLIHHLVLLHREGGILQPQINWQAANARCHAANDGFKVSNHRGIVPGAIAYDKRDCCSIVLRQKYIGSLAAKESNRLKLLAKRLSVGLAAVVMTYGAERAEPGHAEPAVVREAELV